MGKQNSTMSAKCCGCCALALMAIASVLACIALSTDFWYTGIYKVTPYAGGDKFYAAATMGLEKACFYPKTVTADTKKAVDASLGFGILGVIGTAPFAAICLLFYCCPGKNCCASMMHWINIAIGIAVFVCFLISLGVTVGQCEDYAKKDAAVLVGAIVSGTGLVNEQTVGTFWSAILMILALIFSFIAWPVYWRFKCLCDAECAGECENQQPAKNAESTGAQA